MSAPGVGALCPADARPHVEACCATGSSPGTATLYTRRLAVRLDLEHRGPTRAVLSCEVQGPERAVTVVVLGGISADRHLGPTIPDPAPGWWPGIVGRGRALDPWRHRLVGVDYLGGPAAPVPGPGPITTTDQAKAVLAVLDDLEVERAVLVGASYGGMVALALALAAPERVGRLVTLCAAHRSHPMATAVRSLQRKIARLGSECGRCREGLALARALAMTTYRSPVEFEERFGRDWVLDEAGALRFPVEQYLEARGQAFAERFTSGPFTLLSESIDLHDVEPEPLSVPSTLVSFDTDGLVPPWLVEEFRSRVSAPCTHLEMASTYGHDGFLKETGAVDAMLRDALTPGSDR